MCVWVGQYDRVRGVSTFGVAWVAVQERAGVENFYFPLIPYHSSRRRGAMEVRLRLGFTLVLAFSLEREKESALVR